MYQIPVMLLSIQNRLLQIRKKGRQSVFVKHISGGKADPTKYNSILDSNTFCDLRTLTIQYFKISLSLCIFS